MDEASAVRGDGRSRGTRAARIGGALVGLLALLFLLFAAFPWGAVAPWALRRAGAGVGLDVSVGRAVRVDRFSFSPTVRLEGVVARQPALFGPGPMAAVRAVTVRFAAWPLLLGRVRPLGVEVMGARVHLVRLADGRANWRSGVAKSGGGGALPTLGLLRATDTRVRIDDAVRGLALTTAVVADGGTVRLTGGGTLAGEPLRLEATASAIGSRGPYPIRAHIVSPRVDLTAVGATDRPFDFGHWRADVRASGHDLLDLDRIIRAGLFGTQPFALTAAVRHDGPRWTIERLAGRIGRSTVRGRLGIERRDGRSILDGDVHAAALDFDDLASDADLAKGRAREAALGRRVLPHLRIDLSKLGHTDGSIRLVADRLLSDRPTVFRSLAATVTLDHRLLTARPLSAGLVHGTLAGSAVVDHRGKAPVFTLDLSLTGARLEDILTQAQDATGPLRARAHLTGTGTYVSDALARANGGVGFASTGGEMRKLLATLAAGDVLKGLGEAIGGSHDRVAVRCLAGRFRVTNGRAVPAPLVLDTSVMQGRGAGAVDLGSEAIALDLATRSKHPDLIQSAVPIRVRGTLAHAELDVTPPAATKEKHGLFSKVGALLGTLRTRGDAGRGQPAADADCGALVAAALR